MDDILTQFIQRTKADPSLARDLLDATQWDLQAALAVYDGFSVTYEPQDDFSLSEYDNIDLGSVTDELGLDIKEKHKTEEKNHEEHEGDIVKRRRRESVKAKGIARVADEIRELFLKVAITDSKPLGSKNKEQVFNEQFFHHSFLFPDLTSETPELREYIIDSLLEKSHKVALERSGRLNWWASTGKLPQLTPLATSGDGNCLLHAASIYMWGLPDRDLILRTHLHRLLTEGVHRLGLQRRWKYYTNLRNQEAGGLTFSDEEWEFEWSEIVRIATNRTRRRPTTDSLRRYSTLRPHYESLEEIHVFALANVLKRPIIVIADEFLRDMEGERLAPIYFGGIYLPLECSPVSCYKSPLVLAYDSSHFSPLVAKKQPTAPPKISQKGRFTRMDSRQDTVIPLVSPNGSLLPVQFAYDPKTRMVPERVATHQPDPEDFPQPLLHLIEGYLDIRWIQLNIGNKWSHKTDENFPVEVPRVRFPAAVVSCLGEPQYQTALVEKYLHDANERFAEEQERQRKLAEEKAKQGEEFKRLQNSRLVPCEGEGCTMFGKPVNDNLCSVCYAKQKQQQAPSHQLESPPPPPPPHLPEYDNSYTTNNTVTSSSSHKIPLTIPAKTTNEEPKLKHTETPSSLHSQTSHPSPTRGSTSSTSSPLHSPVRSPSLADNTSPLSMRENKQDNRDSPTQPPQITESHSRRSAQQASSPTTPPPNPLAKRQVEKRGGGGEGGYSRDIIKPISVTATSNPLSKSSKSSPTRCRNLNCEFFGSSKYDGYCSQCSRTQMVTDV